MISLVVNSRTCNCAIAALNSCQLQSRRISFADDDLCAGRKVHQFCSITITLDVTLIRRHDLRSSVMDTCEEPAKPKKVKAELGGGSARAFFRIIIYKLLYYYMFITLVAHSLFSTATGPRRMALTVNRVHNNNIYLQLVPRSHSHWRAHAVFGYHRPHRRDRKSISLSLFEWKSINQY